MKIFLSISCKCAAFCLLLLARPSAGWSQVDILLSTGLTFDSTWCYEDKAIEIVGVPSGGFFSGCGISGANGRWYFNGAQAGTGEYTFPLTCTIKYVAPTGDSVIRTIKVHKPVVPMLGPDRAVCNNGLFTLAAEMLYVGEYSYSWMPAQNLGNPYAKETGGSVVDSQQFKVYVRDTLSGCSGVDSVMIYNRTVYADILVTQPYACVGDSMGFASQYTGWDWSYRWDFGDGSFGDSSSISHVYRERGFYPVVLVVDNGDCADTAQHLQEVSKLELVLTGPERVEPGEMIALEARSDQSFQIKSWKPDHLINDQTSAWQQFVPDTTRSYVVVGVSDEGCVDSAMHTVIVNPRVMIPSAFSPNGDGKNDLFRVITWGEPSIIRVFRVFDRWGKLVYGAVGSAANLGWDGMIDGVPAEVGVYHYLIELESVGVTQHFRGDVTLVR